MIIEALWRTIRSEPLRSRSWLALVVAGDKLSAKQKYEDFIALWKDADLSEPVLRQAKAEYATLR